MIKLSPAYQVITYILFGIACFLCLVDLFAVLASLVNPAMLLETFLLTGVIIYAFASFNFVRAATQKGILKRTMYIWLRATAIITTIAAVMTLVDSVILLSNPDLVSDSYNQVMKMQPASVSARFTKSDFINMFSVMMYICEACCLLLLLHVTITFGLLRKHGNLFGKKDEQQLP